MNLSPRDNFYRCMTLIVDNGNEAAWELLDFYLSKQGTTLKDFIENHQHEIYHLHYNYGRCCRCKFKTVKKPRTRILYEAQLDILLDTKGKNIPCKLPTKSCTHTINDHYANANIATNQLDLTLCRCLLINFTNILPSVSVERNSFQNLIDMRNKCCHASKGEIPSQDYQAYKGQIEQSLLALAKIYGKTPEMTLKIKDAEKRPFDESICKQLQQTILHEQILQGVSEHTTIEIQKLGRGTKRTLQTAKLNLKSTRHNASKIQKIEKSSKRTLMVAKSSKRSISKLKVNTERTMNAIVAIREEEKSTATKFQKIDERLSKCDLTQTEIDVHLTKRTFVETPAVQACIKLLDTNSLLILTGAAGTGKSRNSLEILYQFRLKHPEYKLVKLTDLHDFTDVVQDEEKLVILFEDIFGRTNTRFAENTDVQMFDSLHACTIKGGIKVILTVRDTIRMSCEWILNSHKIFHNKFEVDLSSEEYKMTKTEKELLLLKYFVANNFRLLEYNDPENYFEESILDPKITVTVNRVTLHNIVESEPLLGFPEACSLFTGNRKFTRLGISFFKHPSKYLFEEIEKLRINGQCNEQDRMSYLTLVYILLNEDVLDPDDMKLNICLNILESCFGVSNKKLPVCNIIDAAKEMIGRYLILHCDDGTYHLQHQTIFESILISYNRVDPGIILSRLSFDFIREMVRLHKYKQREGEIVMKITSRYYSLLADRIIDIVQSEYFNKSLSVNFALLCESQIIRENDEVFFKHLIEKAHDAYFQPDYDLQTFVTYSGECKFCQLYLPALLLERITQQNKMHKSITLLIDHITQVLHTECDEDINLVCKSSLLEAFLHVCELEKNENILDNIWVSMKSLDMSRINEYIRSSINRLCSRCPITTIKWIVNNIDRCIIDINQILNTACEFKRLDVVEFLCTTLIGEKKRGVYIDDPIFLHTLDKSQSKKTTANHLDLTAAFIAAINNVWNDRDEPVSKWLIENVPHELFDMKKITMKVLDMKCTDDLKFLIQNVDNCMLDMKLVYTTKHKEGRENIENLLGWMAENVKQQKIDIPELKNLPCMVKDIDVVKYLFNIFDSSLLDWTPILVSAVNSDWRGKNKDLIEWLISNVDLKYFEFTKVIQEVHETNEHLLRLLLEKVNSALLDMKQVLNQACRLSWIDVVTWTLHNIEHALLSFEEPINTVFNSWKNDKEDGNDMEDNIYQNTNKKEQLIKLFLENVNHDSLDLKEILNQACRCCSLDVVMFVLKKTDHKRLDVTKAMNIVYNFWIYDNNDENDINKEKNITDRRDKYEPLIELFLKKVKHDSLELKEILNQASRYGSLDVVTLLLENTEHKKLDLMEAVNIAYRSLKGVEDKDNMRQMHEPLIKLILEKVNRESLDFKKVFNQACLYGHFDVVTFVLENIDHEKLNVQEAVNDIYTLIENEAFLSQIETYEPLLILILEKVNHNSLDLKTVLNEACWSGYLYVVTFVLEKIDHRKLDINEAVSTIFRSLREYGNYDNFRQIDETLIKMIIEKVNHESLDLKKVLNQACRYGCLDIVTFVLDNIDHEILDVNEAISISYSLLGDNEDDDNKRQKYEPLIKLILKKVNSESLDLKKILNQACRYGLSDILTLLLETIDHEQLDVMQAVNRLYSSKCIYYDDVNNKRKKYETLIKLILEKVNHESLDLEKVLNQACRFSYLDVVSFMLQNIDHEKLVPNKAMQMAYEQCGNHILGWKKQKYELLLKLILEKVNHATLDLKKVLNQACRYSCLDIVTFVLDNIDHAELDVNEAMNIAYSSLVDNTDDDDKRKKYEPLIRLILKKVNHESLDLKKLFNQACRIGYVDVIQLMLQNIDHEKLDLNEAIQMAYHQGDNNFFGWKEQKNEPLVILILKKVNHAKLDLKKVLNQACRYSCLDIVTFVLDNIDHAELDVNEAMNIAYSSLEDNGAYNNIRQKYEPLIKMILEKVNHGSLDLKKVFNQACRYDHLDIVTFVLENTEQEQLDVMEALRLCRLQRFGCIHYYHQKKVETKIKLILEKVNHELLDLKILFNQSCRFCYLDVVSSMLENIDHEKLDFDESMQMAYDQCGNYNLGWKHEYEPVIKLILEKVNHGVLDLKKVLNQACGYGRLDIVTFMLEIIDHEQLDVKEAMNIAYSSLEDNEAIDSIRKKYEPLIELFLRKVNYDSLDLKKVFNQACRYGCLDIVTFMVEDINHEKFDVNVAMSIAYSSTQIYHSGFSNQRNKYDALLKLILRRVDHDTLDFREMLNQACYYECFEVVTFVLENIDHNKLDIMKAVQILYSPTRVNRRYYNDRKQKELSIRLVLEKVNYDLLDMEKVFEQACSYQFIDVVTFFLDKTGLEKLNIMKAVQLLYRSIGENYDDIDYLRTKYEHLFKLILEKVNNDLLDFKNIMDTSSCYGCLDVVTFVLKNTDHTKLGIMEALNAVYIENYGDDIDDQGKKYVSLIKLIIEEVNHDLLDLKQVFFQACYYGCLDAVTFLLENTDHEKLDLMKAVNTSHDQILGEDDVEQREKKEPLIKLILEKVDHDLLVLKEIMNEACFNGYLNVVTFLLENTDQKTLNIMEAVNNAYSSISGENDYEDNYEDDIDEQREKNESLIKLILDKVDHDLIVWKEIMNGACRYGYLDVVTFLLENTDHVKLDIMKALNGAYGYITGENDYKGDINKQREKKEPLVKLILEKVNHGLLVLKEIMNEACCNGYLNIVTFLLENTDQKKLNIMEAVNNAYSSISGEDDCEDDIDEQRENNKSLIKLILDKVDHDLLDLKEIMAESCRCGYLDVVMFLLENTNHENLNIMQAVNKACNPSIDEDTDNNICDNRSNETLIKFLSQKVKTDLFDMEILMNEACRNGWLNIVRWLVENIDHSMFDVDTTINVVIRHYSVKALAIFKLLLQNISPNLFNIGTVIEQASRLNHTEYVLWLFQNKDSSLFEMKSVMNEACRNGNLRIIKYVLENMDKDSFDVRSAMNKACRSSKTNSLEAVKWLLENIPHEMLDLESAMNNACRYGIVSVVKWFWTTLDRNLFNVKTAWNNACYHCNETLLSYLINTMDENMLDKSKAMSRACRNYKEGERVISLLFEQPNMNTPENCKKALKEACVHSNRPIVEWLLDNTDIQPLELKETLIYTIKATINRSNDKEKSDYKSLVWFMLKHPKVKELERNDLSDVMEAVSGIGQLDMVQRLWNNTEQSIFNTRAIVNTACESGKFEIVDWFLQIIELTNIDVQTVMVESCGYGWLKIVVLLWSKFDIENFDMRTSMNEACSYGRYEIVKFLLEKVDSNLLDTKLVLKNACGYGWKDIILWLFDNTDNISIDSKECIFEACAQGRLEIVELFFSKYGTKNFDVNKLIDVSCNSRNADVVKFFIKNFDLAQSHIDIIIKKACTYSWTEIVTSLIDVCKHSKNLMEEVMKTACSNGETEIVEIFLDKVDTSFLGVNTNMNISCQKGWDEIVSLLLERVDHLCMILTAVDR
ncbi:Hypothetical predicted protein [Mytilus galloprovincialis]|uniref:Novel STAND NTPase 3 domain-containing protein n=1 Tax=Mytilus galloprovincialis TaxID=29158 RepID=A0A8B6BE74_MYTGA|nr:Hypothetical predicted protein [Mytilus galloprovincialis]